MRKEIVQSLLTKFCAAGADGKHLLFWEALCRIDDSDLVTLSEDFGTEIPGADGKKEKGENE